MAVSAMNIGVVGLPGGWSTELLLQAVRDKGARGEIIAPDLMACDLALGLITHRGRDLGKFDALIVKKLGKSYGPEMLDRLSLLDLLATRGVPIFSSPARMEGMLNRMQCTLALAKAGIPMPPTVLCQNPAQGVSALERLGACVLKPLYTSKAKGMRQIKPGPGAYDQLEQYQAQGHGIIYLQQFLTLPGHDLGIVFLGGRYLCTYARGARDFSRLNGGQPTGGGYFAYQPSPPIIELAAKAQAVFGLDFTCVDIVESDDGPLVLEVSAFGGFRGIWEAHGLNAAELYVDHVLSALRR
ncbi:MAG: GAK system ATP-grasp enzyme [Desulfarculus sp.]|nr:GAK system ATP-grasp enzyme [Desulfarculus sp.]